MSRTLTAVVIAALLGACAHAADPAPPTRADAVVKTEAEWRAQLSPEAYRILREKGTERAFTGKYHDSKADGVYACAACGLELFTSDDKFDSGTGWPSYTQPVAKDRVDSHVDRSYGMTRTEVTCARCGGHLGHVFRDGPAPTGLRYCINSASLELEPTGRKAKRKE